MRCLTVLENSPLCSFLPTNLSQGIACRSEQHIIEHRGHQYTNQPSIALKLFSSCFYTTEGQLSPETNKHYYTVNVQLSTKHESNYRATCVSEKTQPGFEVLQKHICIHNSAGMHIASVMAVDKATFTCFGSSISCFQ